MVGFLKNVTTHKHLMFLFLFFNLCCLCDKLLQLPTLLAPVVTVAALVLMMLLHYKRMQEVHTHHSLTQPTISDVSPIHDKRSNYKERQTYHQKITHKFSPVQLSDNCDSDDDDDESECQDLQMELKAEEDVINILKGKLLSTLFTNVSNYL